MAAVFALTKPPGDERRTGQRGGCHLLHAQKNQPQEVHIFLGDHARQPADGHWISTLWKMRSGLRLSGLVGLDRDATEQDRHQTVRAHWLECSLSILPLRRRPAIQSIIRKSIHLII